MTNALWFSQILRLQFLLFISIMSVMWQSSTWERLTHRRERDRVFQLCDWCDLTETKSVQNISQSGVCLWVAETVLIAVISQIIGINSSPSHLLTSYCSKHYDLFLFFLWNTKQTFWNYFHYSLFIHWKILFFLKVSGWKLFNFATFKTKFKVVN